LNIHKLEKIERALILINKRLDKVSIPDLLQTVAELEDGLARLSEEPQVRSPSDATESHDASVSRQLDIRLSEVVERLESLSTRLEALESALAQTDGRLKG
jgi:predicted RNase H-like nuclease (RuvC/YqgF family)